MFFYYCGCLDGMNVVLYFCMVLEFLFLLISGGLDWVELVIEFR